MCPGLSARPARAGDIEVHGFDYDVIQRALPFLWIGLQFSVQLTFFAMVGGIILGTVLAMMRLSSFTVLNLPATIYVNGIRSIPLVLVIFWFYFLVPLILQAVTRAPSPVHVGAEKSALITFILFQAAYYSEIMRAGIQSVSRGQVSAAFALGLTYFQSMGHVILPQAFRNMIPILLTQTIVLFQDTSLVYVLSITDLLGAAVKTAQRDGRLIEMYVFVAVIYFVLSYALSEMVRRLQTKVAVIR